GPNGPPASPTLPPEATPLPQSRSRATSNLFSKLTSKLTRRVTLDPSKRQSSNRCVSGTPTPPGAKISKCPVSPEPGVVLPPVFGPVPLKGFSPV
ncbi:MARK3 kinase, partial [Grus americana]|nr:MARK3 kinase [Grus americana]